MAAHRGSDGRLSWGERRFLALLGLPALGLTFAVTVASTYLPVLIERSSGPLVAGVLVGGEGFFAIFVPTLVGSWSDRSSRSVGDRLRFLVVAGPLGAGLLVLCGVLGSAGSLVALAVGLALFYLCYYAYLAPYWAAYPDLVPAEESGRSRSAESVWRVVGSGAALIAGGALLAVWEPLPFVLAAVLLCAVTAALVLGLGPSRRAAPVGSGRGTAGSAGEGIRSSIGNVRRLLRDDSIRRLVVANALWNFVLAGLRAFVVLFFTVGLDRSPSFVSGVIFPLVAVGLAVAAPLAGTVADRIGHIPLLRGSVLVYGVGLLLPALVRAPWVIALIPVVAAAAATVMTLPYSVLMRLLPDGDHGAAAGLFGFSRGVGGFLGPVVVGAAIELSSSLLSSTSGYAALWLVIGVGTLASVPFLSGVRVPGEGGQPTGTDASSPDPERSSTAAASAG